MRLKAVSAVLTAAILLLTSCAQQPSVRTAQNAVEDTQVASNAPTEVTEAPTELPTEPPTEPPTEAFSAVVIDDVPSDPYDIYDSTGFVSASDVIPDVKLDIRYYSDHNFVGCRIDGYEEPLALLTKEAARALCGAADDLRDMGYGVMIYDAYRPQRAVNHFISWAGDYSDTKMKEEFYPDLDKSVLFDYGYIGYQSGHSRGSTVDLTLYELTSGREVDMGGGFDYFSAVSHPDYTEITDEQYRNRQLLRSAMTANGFTPLSTEWWHFTLSYEPYPSTYFDFPVKSL